VSGVDRPLAQPGLARLPRRKENVYTCTCGNQTWTILENQVQCTACDAVYDCLHTPVKDFNHMVTEEIEELEEAAP
jgi:hypothetical protein